MKLKENLKTLMEQKKISLLALAKTSGVSKSTLHDWLTGSSPKKLEHVKAVADYFDLTINDLCFSNLEEAQIPKAAFIGDKPIIDGLFHVTVRKVK